MGPAGKQLHAPNLLNNIGCRIEVSEQSQNLSEFQHMMISSIPGLVSS